MTNPNHPDQEIIKFLRSHHQFTMATSVEEQPYCAICYFVYSENLNAIIFKSSSDSRHIKEALRNAKVAAAIISSTNKLTESKGVQIEGKFIEPNTEQVHEAKRCYYLKFPFALAISGNIWLIELTKIKYTDNHLGHQNKLNWELKQ